MIITINADKAFDKNQHPFMIKKKKKTKKTKKKTSPESRHIRNISQPNKSHV